jgi:hypothetical protein
MGYGNDLKEVSKFSFLGVVGFTVAFISLTFIGYSAYRIFAPLDEQVRYNTFKESQSYNDKVAQDLSEMMANYQTTDADHQQAISQIVKQRYAGYDANKLPPTLHQFLTSTRGY